MAHKLTKSKYILGLQCERALYLSVYRPELARYSDETLLKFRKGRGFEQSFKALFPQGIDVSAHLGKHISRYAKFTAKQLSQPGEVVLFEAGFVYNDVLVLADVLRKSEEGIVTIYEVKNSLHVSDTFRHDVAIQHYVISHALRDILIPDLFSPYPHIDHFYLLHNDGAGGFVLNDLLAHSIQQMSAVGQHVQRFKAVLDHPEPLIPMSAHCHQPYVCPFKAYCARHLSC